MCQKRLFFNVLKVILLENTLPFWDCLYGSNLVPRARAHLRSAGSKCHAADQKECSLWERDWYGSRKIENLVKCSACTI